MHFGNVSGVKGPGVSLVGLPSTEICSAVMPKEHLINRLKTDLLTNKSANKKEGYIQLFCQTGFPGTWPSGDLVLFSEKYISMKCVSCSQHWAK